MTRLWDKGAPLDQRVLRYTAGEDHALVERSAFIPKSTHAVDLRRCERLADSG